MPEFLAEQKLREPFDPMSRRFAQDPYSVYAQLRALKQPYYYQAADIWLLSTFADVNQVACNSNMVRSMDAFMSCEDVAAQKKKINWHDMPNHSRFVQFSLLDSDGDVHMRLRKLVMREFSSKFVQHHRGMIQRYVDKLLDELCERKEFDFIADFAAHVPGHIIGNVLGVPDEDCPQLRIWSENVVQFFDVARTDTHKKLAEQATTEFYYYLLELIAQRTKHPEGDLLSTLINAKNAGQLDETELISTCMLILMAGHGSTIDALGCGMNTLLNNPDQYKELSESPELAASAVQEMLRYESPLPFFHRYAAQEQVVLGKSYPQGTKFGLLYGAANRDSSAFPDADQFNIRRNPNRHLAFGRGAHLCLGNHLSRLDMEIIFLSLAKRTASIERLVDQAQFKPGLSVRGLVSLPVRVQAK